MPLDEVGSLSPTNCLMRFESKTCPFCLQCLNPLALLVSLIQVVALLILCAILKICINRSSRPEVFCKTSVLRNFAKFTGKHLCQSLFSDKFSDLRLASSLKTRLWHRPFPMNFAKFLRTRFLQNTSGGCFCINKYFISLLILLLFVF